MTIRYIVPEELKWLYDDNDNKILIPRILGTIFCDILARKDEGRGTRYLIKFSTASGDIIKGWTVTNFCPKIYDPNDELFDGRFNFGE